MKVKLYGGPYDGQSVDMPDRHIDELHPIRMPRHIPGIEPDRVPAHYEPRLWYDGHRTTEWRWMWVCETEVSNGWPARWRPSDRRGGG